MQKKVGYNHWKVPDVLDIGKLSRNESKDYVLCMR